MPGFIFGGEEHTFDARYIGNAPTKNTKQETVLEAVGLLQVKLEKMHMRAVEAHMQLKYGEGTSSSKKMNTISKVSDRTMASDR